MHPPAALPAVPAVAFAFAMSLSATVLIGTKPANAADEKAAPVKPEVKLDAAPEVMKDAVDPYTPGKQRQLFLKAAGVDSELDEKEFEADAKAAAESGTGFVRSYDKWKTLRRFDINNDTRLDWFEADQYRRAVRRAVLQEYDTNEDGQLKGAERDKANRALADGKLPELGKPKAAAKGDAPAIPGPGNNNPGDRREQWRQRRDERRRQFIQRWDTDGDGELSDAEREAMASTMIFEGRERQVRKWDEDGDGKLSDAERAKVMQDPRDKWWLQADDLGMRHFDEDGDGKLSKAESDSIVDFGKQLQTMGKKWEVKMLDTDGDGDVSGNERRAFMQRMQMVGIGMLPKAMKWGDMNGDGRVDMQERLAVMDRVQTAAKANIKKWESKFDADGNGRLDANERKQLVSGINTDIKLRMERNDKDGDGKISNEEMMGMVEELAAEWGVKPTE